TTRNMVFDQYPDFCAFSKNCPSAQSAYLTALCSVAGLLPVLMRPAGNSQGEWLLTVKATVNVGTSCLSESSSCSLLNMSSSDAPHVPTKLGFLNVCISCSSLKPLERKKPDRKSVV